jgi:hypothetical protein
MYSTLNAALATMGYGICSISIATVEGIRVNMLSTFQGVVLLGGLTLTQVAHQLHIFTL